jgi:hypothetical protein
MDRSDAVASQAGALVFDGDRAMFSFSVTAPKAPFTVTQSATCASVPTVGVPATCTITESVTNSGAHTMDFTGTVVNHLATNVHAVSATTSSGTIVTSGSSVVWNSFKVAPGQTVSASIQVSFTPTAAQAGSQVVLSNSITADARDVVTGQKFVVVASGVSTPTRVARPGAAPTSAPSGGVRTAPSGGATTSPSVSGLPATGGAANQAAFRRRGG